MILTTFAFVFTLQYVVNAFHLVLPKKYFMLKIAASLKIASKSILEKCIKDDLPPLKRQRHTPETELAGFIHEIDRKYKPVLSSFSSIYNIAAY
jgi:hypothetical protein